MINIEQVRTALAGKKTYILSGLAIVVVIANLAGLLDSAAANTLLGLLGFGSVITLKAGINRSSR